MAQMPITDAKRFRRALVPVIGLLLIGGTVAAATHEVPPVPVGGGVASGGDPSPAGQDAPAVPTSGTASSVAADSPTTTRRTTTTLAPTLGAAVVPAPGLYRYEVDAVRLGTRTTRSEEREITLVGEEGGSSIVQIVARSEGEQQVSVLDWSSDGVFVRSTRIESGDATTQDCTWEPSFPEFGPLGPDAAWSLASTCTFEVAGLPTTFVVTGTGRVAGRAEVVHGGSTVPVWQVERDRTTTITATVGANTVEQVVREMGTFFIDPARGLVLRSDVTHTLSGTQQAVTRRTSVLVED